MDFFSSVIPFSMFKCLLFDNSVQYSHRACVCTWSGNSTCLKNSCICGINRSCSVSRRSCLRTSMLFLSEASVFVERQHLSKPALYVLICAFVICMLVLGGTWISTSFL